MSNKDFFQSFDLEFFHSRGLQKKIEEAIAYSQKILAPYSSICLSFSGGKDSQLAFLILEKAGISFDVVSLLSQFEFKDTERIVYYMCKKYKRNLEILWNPEDSLERYIKARVFSDTSRLRRIIEQVDAPLREYNKRYEVNIVAIRKQESKGRRILLSKTRGFWTNQKTGCTFFSPIYNFSNNEVFACITALGEEYHELYYRASSIEEREWLRIDWYLCPNAAHLGYYAFLKKHYPEHFYHLACIYPYIKTYV